MPRRFSARACARHRPDPLLPITPDCRAASAATPAGAGESAASIAAAAAARSSSSGVGSAKGRPLRDRSSSSRYVVWNAPSTNAGCASSHRKNGTVVLIPATRYSPSARRIRAIASGRSSAHATSFEIIGS